MGLMTINIDRRAPIIDPVAEVTYWARQVSACALMDEIATLLDVDHGLVWQVLCTVPDNMLTLLDSPQGWGAISGYVSAELGIVCPDYMPAVH